MLINGVSGFRAKKLMKRGIIMGSKYVAGNTCYWCVAATTLEEKIKGIKSIVGKTCVWCVAATIAALILLTVMLVSN